MTCQVIVMLNAREASPSRKSAQEILRTAQDDKEASRYKKSSKLVFSTLDFRYLCDIIYKTSSLMKYPIGIQSFTKIIENGYVYVDKTELIYNLTHEGSIYFLSRPRRFGKSLLVSTLENYYLGHKELFKGLAMERLEKDWAVHPVFHIDFNSTNFTNPGELEQKLDFYVSRWMNQYGLPPEIKTLGTGDRFVEVLRAAHERTGCRAVVLIDEYDKPILDVLDVDAALEDRHRNVLKAFYSVFKAADEHLQFVLLTGVTKFSQVSVFSGFNQPKDISMDGRYEALCGITQEEIERYFNRTLLSPAHRRHGRGLPLHA